MPIVGPVATALPETRLAQAHLKALAGDILPEGPGKATVLAMFDNARIDERALACPIEWYTAPHGHKDRAEVFQRVGLDLVERSLAGALEQAGLAPRDLDGLLLVSTTGLATPSLDARVMNRLPLRPNLKRIPVWGLGCAGGVGGLNRAADLARGDPDGHYAVVCLELCSLLFDIERALTPRPGGPDRKALVAASLFGDGAAATLVSGDDTGAQGLSHIVGASHLFPATERVMGWDIEDHNLDVVLSPRIPDIVRAEVGPLVKGLLASQDLVRPDRWVLHPGGTKVIEAYQDALQIGDDDLAATTEALRKHGNMSSPTVLFALQESLGKPPAKGDSLLLGALGPGFASELAILEA